MEEKALENNEVSNIQNYSFSFKWLITTVIAVWPWFVGSVLVCLLIGNLYLRYSKEIYKITGEVLVNDNKTTTTPDESVLQELGVNTIKSDVNNVSRALKSKYAMTKVVDSLQLNIHYVESGNVKTLESYKGNPFFIEIPEDINKVIDGSYEYKVKPVKADGFVISDKVHSWSGKWGDSVSLPVIGKVAIVRGTYPIDPKVEYKVIINSESNEANSILGRLTVNIPDKQSNVIDLTLLDEIPERAQEVINTLVSVYKVMNIEERNQIANNTIVFIKDRLDTVKMELSKEETAIEDFKVNNDLTDIKEQSKMLVESSGEYLKELSGKQVQLSVIEDLERYLKSNENNGNIMPATLMADQSFQQLMMRYNTLEVERGRLLLSNTESNPMVVNIDEQLKGLRADMLIALASVKNSLIVTIDEIKKQSGSLDQQLRGVPVKERQFLDYTREQNIMQDLFLFLLKKQEEAALSKKTTVANITFLDGAVNIGAISPNRSRILMISLVIGLLIPGSVIFLRKTLNNTIITKADITSSTTIPLLGEISHYNDKNYVAVSKNDNSVISEQFRALRTNLQFFLPDKNNKTILLTSSMSGEGKSFIAVNLAITFAISGKRVVLIELDLRKPKISKKLNIENKVGFSTYAIGQADINQIILPSGIDDNLFIIPSGPIPPNPAELIILPKIDKLFEVLRDNFDYIIIDTSPIGLVIDAQLLSRFADTSLYLVRQGYTYKQQLQIINDLKKSDKLPKISLVINDVIHKRGFMYGYGYGYEYGYGYSYGYGNKYGDYVNDNNKKGKFNLKRFSKKDD